MLSFWEREHFLDFDLVIIGGGITGLSCAAEVLERHPQQRVLVVERGLLPTGASTKNAGFACFGSLTELLSDLDTMGVSAALELVRQRKEGLNMLRNRLGDRVIGYTDFGGHELISEAQQPALDRMDDANELLNPLFKKPVYVAAPKLISQFGFSANHIISIVTIAGEGQLNTGLMMRGLMNYVARLGVQFMTGAEVIAIGKDGEGRQCLTVKGLGGESLELRADKVAVCTNAFAKRLIPELDVVPGRGQVLCTTPVKGLKFRGSFHMDEGYYYFRSIGDRVMLGGGRNLDMITEQTDAQGINELIREELERRLREIILPGQTYQVEQCWSGTMAFGASKQPVVALLQPGLAVGVRLSGMGVALGSKVGAMLTDLLYPA